jgi:hypothetical protein
LILGTSESEGNIHLGNSRAKFSRVVKMLTFIDDDGGKRGATGMQMLEQWERLLFSQQVIREIRCDFATAC